MLDLLWWIGWAWCAAWIALPLVAASALGPVAGAALWALAAPWSALLGLAALHRLLPDARCGTFRLPGDAGATCWALKGWAPAVYLTLFQPLFFASRTFQRIVQRAFGARLGAGAWPPPRTTAWAMRVEAACMPVRVWGSGRRRLIVGSRKSATLSTSTFRPARTRASNSSSP